MSRRPPHRGRSMLGVTGRQLGIVILLLAVLMVVGGVLLGNAFGVFHAPLTPAASTPPELQAPGTVAQGTPVSPQVTAKAATQPLQVAATATPGVIISPTAWIASPTVHPREVSTATNTATTTTSPAPGVCSQISLQFLDAVSNVAQWRLQNTSGVDLELTLAQVDWSRSNEAFYYIFLDGAMIWSSEDLAPPTIISSWIGTTADRMVKGVVKLELLFGLNAAESGYNMQLWFGNGCQVSAAN
jgi:hypothetical protein